MLIAQFSDCHIAAPGAPSIRGVADASESLARCVRHINGLDPRPDIAVGTGDLVHDGTPAAYAELRALLAPLTMPVYLLPGNHDDRGNLRAAFPGHAYLPRDGRFLHYAVEDRPLRLVCLDTVIPGEVGGEICPERRAWLAARLAEAPDRPTVIFMHHPPFAIGIGGMDAASCAGAAELGELIRRHPQVERVLAGHVHRPAQLRWYGTLAATAPSTAAQLRLDLRPGARAAFGPEPAACLLHLWRPEAGLVSHLSYIDGYGRAAAGRRGPARVTA